MISGTSYDGIDCSIGEFTPHGSVVDLKPLFTKTIKYSEEVYKLIDASMPPAKIELQQVCELDVSIGSEFARAALESISESGVTPDLIVSHGQTMYHWVSPQGVAIGTLQLGDGARVAEETGIPTLAQLRSRDVAAGGHGAPYASLIDHFLLAGTGERTAALNLGGISNMTVVDPQSSTIAFDIGPSNALIDAAVRIATNGSENYDEGGNRAASGRINQVMLDDLLSDPYYSLPYPKSTGKELFNTTYLQPFLTKYASLEINDVIATLTQLTAVTICNEINKANVAKIYVSGGGIHNKVLMESLRKLSPSVIFLPYEELKLNADGKEAFLFALIGFLSTYNQAGNIPSSTGAKGPRILGCFHAGKNGFPEIKSNPENFRALRIS